MRRIEQQSEASPGGLHALGAASGRRGDRAAPSDLEAARREIASLRQALDQLAADREELLAVVSHEFRTPVTVIRGYNNLLLSGDVGALSEQQRDFLDQSNRSCERLNRLIGDLLAACGDASGGQNLDLRPGSIDELLFEVIAYLRPLLDERDLAVELRVDREASRAHFEPHRIEQVLTNLLVNAIRFSKRGTAVCIRGTAPSDCPGFIELSVIDTGPGVAPEDRERVFEPYVRAADDHRPGGLGLGLAICKRIVSSHGGTVGVVDEPGWGARFHFTLPAVEDEEVG